MNKEQLVSEVSNRTGIMPEVTEIVIDTAGTVIGDDVREHKMPIAAALLLAGTIVRKLRRRRA